MGTGAGVGWRGVGYPAPMSNNPLAAKASTSVQFAHKVFKDMWKGWPADQACALPAAHDNHLLWNIGHMAVSNDWFFALMSGEPGICPPAWEKLFGMGSKPSSDPKTYPPLGEVQGKYESGVQRVLAELSKRSDAELLRPVVGESYGLAKDRVEAALGIAWHTGWHTGQIASCRRGLGLPSTMGGG